ncbi:MAG: glycosyltransferase family 9 protein [Sedimentisphaerales bacterium]|nr:glycosyltransferase family 9 protein [Sedimentisphaerales bacterium]
MELLAPATYSGSGSATQRSTITVRRLHGLGNLVCLLPVLDYLYERDVQVRVITRPEWRAALSRLRPQFSWLSDDAGGAEDDGLVDLDALTEHRRPAAHRTDEFARLLDIHTALPACRLEAPEDWRGRFTDLAGSIALAPEAAHPSRRWPSEKVAQLPGLLAPQRVILIGTGTQPAFADVIDTRGRLALAELIGLLSVCRAVVTMDSAVLHLAAALGVPTVALFGGIHPGYRVRPEQRIVVVQAELLCCPCNKQETCSHRYDCIRLPEPPDIVRAVELAGRCRSRRRLGIRPSAARVRRDAV